MIAPELDFSLTSDADVALKDADYIITTIRAEGDEGRVFDERTALNEGVLGQETTGAGGFAIGLGAQSLVKDLINGFFLLFEDLQVLLLYPKFQK